MKTLEDGKEKVRRICDIITKETLEPAQKKAEEIVVAAQTRAEEIIDEAQKKAQKILDDAKLQIEHERNVFNSSLQQASKQSIEALRQSFEKQFFSSELDQLLQEPMQDKNSIANLIKALIQAIEKEGLAANLSIEIPKSVSAKEINGILGQQILKSIESGSVSLGNFQGGVKVRVNDRRMTLEVTEEVIKNLLASYLRKDFRKAFFGT